MNESIREIKNEIYRLQRELQTLREANSAYFVLWEEVGSDTQYSRYYTPIGRITEDLAIQAAEDARRGENTIDAGYREVSEHEYQLFKEAAAIAKIQAAIRDLSYCVKVQRDSVVAMSKELHDRDIEIRNGLKIRYHWEHFLPEKWVRYEEFEEEAL